MIGEAIGPSIEDESDTSVVFQYDTEGHSINAFTLIESLHAITGLMQEAHAHASPRARMEIHIGTLRPGSFLVPVDVRLTDVAAVIGLFTVSNLDSVKALLETLKAWFEIRRFCKEKSPEVIKDQKGMSVITRGDGNTTIVASGPLNVYMNNPNVGERLDAHYKALDEDKEVEGFGVLGPDGSPPFLAPRSEFHDMVIGNTLSSAGDTSRSVVHRVRLSVAKPDLIGDAQWEFVYLGNRIKAKITDGCFIKKLRSGGIHFGYAPTMDVELTIAQVPNQAHIYENKAFVISKVYGYCPESRPPELPFADGTDH